MGAYRERHWLAVLACVSGVQIILGWMLYRYGLAPAPMFRTYGAVTIAILLGITVCWVLLTLRRSFLSQTSPIGDLREAASSGWKRLAVAMVALQITALSSASAAALKSAIPKISPFRWDEPLANLDKLVFGDDPWRISHALLGWATPAIDFLYAIWVGVQLIVLYSLLFSGPSRLKSQALICQSLCWLVLATFLAYALSSAGPVFYDRLYGTHRFPIDLTQAPLAKNMSDLLWGWHAGATGGVGRGISAMPSLHVAISMWGALWLRKTKFAPLAWGYLAVIQIGSVHLGWHYFSDGLVSIAVVLVLWNVSGRIADRLAALQTEFNRRPRRLVKAPASR